MADLTSEVRFLWVIVEILQELRLFAVLSFLHSAKALVALHHTFALRCNLVEDSTSPNVTILH